MILQLRAMGSYICKRLRVSAGSAATPPTYGVLCVVCPFQDEKRDRFKLILNCIMIITSVIPPGEQGRVCEGSRAGCLQATALGMPP